MTNVGNRDSSYGSTQVSGSVAHLAEVVPAHSSREFGAVDNRRILLRLHGDDSIVVGNAEGRDNAVRVAREMVQHIEHAATNGEWPQIDDRFIRPGAIVSVDVQRAE